MGKQFMWMAALRRVSNMMPRLKIVMGVCGVGKSTVAKLLADATGGVYLDGDDYHPQANITKMSQDMALTDDDRWPWLQNFAESMSEYTGNPVGACSALTKTYRQFLTQSAGEPILFICLEGSKKLIEQRMSDRVGHFMPSSQLDNQLAMLEVPGSDERALNIDISASSEQIIANILEKLAILHTDAS